MLRFLPPCKIILTFLKPEHRDGVLFFFFFSECFNMFCEILRITFKKWSSPSKVLARHMGKPASVLIIEVH